jgi:hypothetical protein
MLFRETVAVYCENHTGQTDTLCGQNAVYINSVRTSQETHDIRYKTQPVNAVGKQSLFIVRTVRNTQIHSVGRMARILIFLNVEAVGAYSLQCPFNNQWARCVK